MNKKVTETKNRPTADDARSQLLKGLPVVERRLQIAGVSTALLEGGDGLPVILLHGPGEYGAKWLRVIPDLVKTHRVIAPDLPGHGTSEVMEGTLDMEEAISWLDKLIEQTCHVPPVLVGQISGGAIAARYASRRNDRINRLVLVDTLGLTAFQPRPDFGQALSEFMAEPTEETHDRFWRLCAYDLDALSDNLGDRWHHIKAYNLDLARQADLKAVQHKLMEDFGFPEIPSEELKRISVPTTLIWGRHDLATSLEAAQKAGARYGWPLHVIENSADDPALEQPEAFLKALRTAMRS